MEIKYSEDKKVLIKATDISGDFIIPDGVERIEEKAFWDCKGLTSISIPFSVKSIGKWAFSDCSNLASIIIENENPVYDSREGCNAIIETASNMLIAGCKNTRIPTSVTSIGDYAFSGCKGLASITIPSSVTKTGIYAFSGCSSLTTIIVEKMNPIYDSREGCNAIIETASNMLIAGCKNSKIPSSVTSIGTRAFSGCDGMTAITIPSSVTSIGESAFEWCSNLKSITIPSSVTSIEKSAFDECWDLTSVTIPDSVTSIEDQAFLACIDLTSISIPFSVKSIGEEAFSCCGLRSIKILGKVESIGKKAFYCCESCTLYVPSGMKSYYKNHPEFEKFEDIVEMESETESLT